MSYCCCCQWCAELQCCPGLKSKQENSRFPHIQYSPVSVEKPSSDGMGISHGRVDDQLLEAHRVPNPEMVFSFVQDKSRFSVHPQMGVSTGNNPVTEQPSTSSFMQRFCLTNEAGQHHFPYLPVYREKTVNINDPIIQFSLHYDVQHLKLRVHLQHASNLLKESLHRRLMSAQCDPYVMLHLEPDREDTFQSQIVKNTRNPVFDQDFEFRGISLDNILQQTLVYQVYNHASNKSIGRACLPLADVELSGVVVQMKTIDTEDSEVHIMK